MKYETSCIFHNMFHHMHQFLKNGMYTDVTFVIGTTKIPAHKSVLAASSDVFHTMFQSNMNEAQSNKVDIADANEDSFRNFLDYIYTGEIKNIEKNASTLLMYADKYNIDLLSTECDQLIEGTLTTNNVAEYLVIAEVFSRQTLKRTLCLFIKENLEAVMATENWRKIKNKASFVQDIFHANGVEIELRKNGKDIYYDSQWANYTWFVAKNLWGANDFSAELSLELPTGSGSKNVNMKVNLEPVNLALVVNAKIDQKLVSYPLTTECTVRRIKDNTLIYTNNMILWCPSGLTKMYRHLFVVDGRTFGIGTESFEPFSLTIKVCVGKVMYTHLHQPGIQQKTAFDQFTDGILIVENTKFPIHRAFFTTRSEFFMNLLTNEQTEYVIENITKETYCTVREFIYSNTFPSSEKIDVNLLIAAHKFRLEGLVDYCIEWLKKHVNTNNALDICIESDQLSLITLKKAALNFMESHQEEFLTDQRLTRLEETNCQLFEEILKSFCKYLRKV